MPWCPVCHAEYRAGVKVCRQCQAELVSTPPRAGERYTPPAESLFDTMAEALSKRARPRGWGRQIGQGLRLFGESFRLMLRMRNAWLVLAVLTMFSTVTRLRALTAGGATSPALLYADYFSFSAEAHRVLSAWWGSPAAAIAHVSGDVRSGLETPLSFAADLYFRAVGVYSMNPARMRQWYDPRVLLVEFLLVLLGAAFSAGMLRWLLAAVRGGGQTGARFWEGLRQSFWPLLAWGLAFSSFDRALMLIGPGVPAPLGEVVMVALAVLLLPLLFTREVIVVLRPPVYWAPVISAQVFVRSLLVILGFAVPFIVLCDVTRVLDSGLHYRYLLTWDPEYRYRYAVPVLAFAVKMARVAAELLITTAFVILVARWKEADEVEPAPPEAASA
jgi:hypothetical protein